MKRLAIAVSLLLASGAEARDLLEVYQLAVQNDTQLLASGATLEAQRQNKPIAKSGLLPQIALSGSAERVDQNTSGIGSETFDSTRWGIDLAQPLYRRDRWYQYKQSENSVAQAEAEYLGDEQGVILRVAQAYFDILAGQDALRSAKAERRALDRQLDQAQQRYDVGLIAITDVLEVKSVRDNAVASEIEAQQALEDANDALREIIATDPGKLAVMREDVKLRPPEPNDPRQWEDLAAQNNPRLKAAEEAAEVARQEVEVQKSGHYPALDLVGGYSDSDSGSSFARDSDGTSIGLQLSVPIYTGGRVTATTSQARHNLKAALERLEGTRRQLERQVGTAFRGVVTSISRTDALAAAKVSTASALEATQAGYDVGTRTIVDVLLAQRNFFNAETEHAISRYRYVLNLLALEDAAGTLDDEDVKWVNAWLRENP